MKPARLRQRAGPRNAVHRQRRDTYGDAACRSPRVSLRPTRANSGSMNTAVRYQPPSRRAVAADDAAFRHPVVVQRDMGEHRAAGDLAQRPDAGRRGCEPLVDHDEAARLERRPRRSRGRCPLVSALGRPRRGCPTPRGCGPRPAGQRRVIARPNGPSPRRSGRPGSDGIPSPRNRSWIAARHVGVLARGELRPALDDGHRAAEPPERLRHLHADIAAAEHQQMRAAGAPAAAPRHASAAPPRAGPAWRARRRACRGSR